MNDFTNVRELLKALSKEPPELDDEEVEKVGEWLFYRSETHGCGMGMYWDDYYKCSVCGGIQEGKTAFCPHCGIKMEVKKCK